MKRKKGKWLIKFDFMDKPHGWMGSRNKGHTKDEGNERCV